MRRRGLCLHKNTIHVCPSIWQSSFECASYCTIFWWGTSALHRSRFKRCSSDREDLDGLVTLNSAEGISCMRHISEHFIKKVRWRNSSSVALQDPNVETYQHKWFEQKCLEIWSRWCLKLEPHPTLQPLWEEGSTENSKHRWSDKRVYKDGLCGKQKHFTTNKWRTI